MGISCLHFLPLVKALNYHKADRVYDLHVAGYYCHFHVLVWLKISNVFGTYCQDNECARKLEDPVEGINKPSGRELNNPTCCECQCSLVIAQRLDITAYGAHGQAVKVLDQRSRGLSFDSCSLGHV